MVLGVAGRSISELDDDNNLPAQKVGGMGGFLGKAAWGSEGDLPLVKESSVPVANKSG
jgi:hypothetical protein